jgi:thiol-disulfide isomerase/thioredoxin
MPGLYLLGLLKMEGIKSEEPVGLGRLLSGVAFLIFSITLVPGMFGGKLGELDGYVPVSAETELAWMKNDLPGALAKAKAEGKKVLVNFTGYACTNCHWMKANMFTRPEIAGLLKNFVLVDLYTDGTDEASQTNQKLEESKFGTIAIPFYVIYDADQNVVATFPALTRNPNEYAAFLNTPSTAATVPTTPTATLTGGTDLDGLVLTKVDGTGFDKASLKGRPVVVDFWATWCVPCRKEIPGFNKLAASGATVVGVSMDEDGAALVKKFLKEFPMQYPVGLGAQSNNDRFKITQLPTTIVFDRNGKIVDRFEGLTPFEKIEEAVRKNVQSN